MMRITIDEARALLQHVMRNAQHNEQEAACIADHLLDSELRGLSQGGLARAISVPPNRISAIINGKRAITADTALRLGKYFGVSPEIWLDLQSDYDLRLAQRNDWPKIEPHILVHAA